MIDLVKSWHKDTQDRKYVINANTDDQCDLEIRVRDNSPTRADFIMQGQVIEDNAAAISDAVKTLFANTILDIGSAEGTLLITFTRKPTLDQMQAFFKALQNIGMLTENDVATAMVAEKMFEARSLQSAEQESVLPR